MKLGKRAATGLCLAACFWGFAALGAAMNQTSIPPSISRADFAAAYLRFETAFLKATLDDSETARVNRAFDRLTLSFFTRNFSAAIQALDTLTMSLDPNGAGVMIPKLGPYRVRFNPATHVPGRDRPFLTADILYKPGLAVDGIMVTLRLRPADLKKTIDIPLEMKFSPDLPVLVEAGLEGLEEKLVPGRYEVGFAMGPLFLLSGYWSVVSAPPAERVEANTARLAKIGTFPVALLQASVAVAARNRLLSDTPDPQNTAQMLFDPEALAVEVEAEIGALEKGRNPFVGKSGDYWRAIKTEEREVPFRVYCPPSVTRAKSSPLIVAFHGAGGDENMFMDAYGGGLIKRLAERHGFIIVSPLTNAFGGSKGVETFDRMIDVLAADYRIDRTRIYVLGHSMGGSTAGALAAARPGLIAAAACLNGFNGFKDDVKKISPTLVVASELDPIAGPSRIEPAFKKAQAAGLPVEYRFLKNYGHTLAVTKILPEAIAWLLARSR
jgi:predicted esterase